MAVEFDVKGTRTSEYLFAPEQLEIDPSLNGRHELPDIQWIVESILTHGQLQPVTIRRSGGKPVLVAGFSRWRAISEINKKKLAEKPLALRCSYTQLTEKQAFLANIEENRVRNATTPMDDAFLKLREGIFEVQSTNGDTHLGGDDIDNLLLTIALNEIHAEHGIDLRLHPGAVQAVRKAAIEIKILLSTESIAHFDIELPNGDRNQREIPRAVFEMLIEPVLKRTVGPCKQALADAGITPEQIDEVVLVGGSTRIPAVQQLVDELFHLTARGKRPHTELNPDEVVALGAAVQAGILSGASKSTEEMLLLDVTPLSLGIEALGGTVARIIQRNSTIPASATEHFTTGVDGHVNWTIGAQSQRDSVRRTRVNDHGLIPLAKPQSGKKRIVLKL